MRSIAALIVLACGGCAMGNVGTQVAEVWRTPDALMVETRIYGLHFRIGEGEPFDGVGLGYARRRILYAATAAPEIITGTYWFRVPLPDQGQLLVENRQIGLDLQAGAHGVGLSLGFLGQTRLSPVDPDSDFRLIYDTTRPFSAMVWNCRERKCP